MNYILRSSFLSLIVLISLIGLTYIYPQKHTEIEAAIISINNIDAHNHFESLSVIEKYEPKDSTIIELLLQCFSNSDPYVNGKAANILSKVGKKAVPFLLKSLHDNNPNVRWCSAIALSKMGKEAEEAKAALVKSSSDSDDNVRWCSIIALINLDITKETIDVFRNALSDSNEYVKWAAAKALMKLSPETLKQVPDISSIISEIDELTPYLMNKYYVPGVSIAVIKNRKLFWQKSYGVSNVNTMEPVTNETLFEACSMSKPLFAYIVMKLVEEGKIDLDLPLVEYSAESCFMNDPYIKLITARMVLSHSTGFPNWRMGEEERDGPIPILFEPGSRFGYSGEGMYYLQRVIEKITGESLDKYASCTLFQPMELKNICFSWNDKIDKNLASGHDLEGAYLSKTKYIHANSAYSLYTSAEDYAKYIVDIMKVDKSNEYSLPQKSVNQMLSRQIIADVREPIERPRRAIGFGVYWGLGWGINSTAKGDMIYHSGANRSGFRCYSQFDPEEGSGIVIMTNSLSGGKLWRELVRKIGDL